MRERAVSDLQKKEICSCTAPYPELRNRKIMTMTAAVQAVLRAVVRAFRAQAEIIDSISMKRGFSGGKVLFFCMKYLFHKRKINVKFNKKCTKTVFKSDTNDSNVQIKIQYTGKMHKNNDFIHGFIE